MKCWICGKEGTTGEHLTKHSDLKSVFGHVTQKSPIYLHRENEKNIKISSIKKSPEIKSKALLCPDCNNSRSAPYDRAWETLSTYLRKRPQAVKKGDIIQLHKVFPGKVHQSMLCVHLYFVKLFGCLIVEENIPINIDRFRMALLQEKSHKLVFIALWGGTDLGTGNSDVEIDLQDGECVFATWFYSIDDLTVNIMYAEAGQRRKGLREAWHPDSMSKKIKVVGL